MKPFGVKNYGSIPHLPGSRLGEGDHHCHEGQARIATVKVRDKYDRILVQEKLDGCLTYRSEILTDQGSVPIGKIVNQQLPLQVLTYNLERQCLEYKPIEAYHKQVCTQSWMRIRVRTQKRGTPYRSVTCTPNHHVLTQRGWLCADEVVEGDGAFLYSDVLDSETEQILLGTLLGDGCVSYTNTDSINLTFGHGISQQDYFDFKLGLLGSLATRQADGRGGYEGSGVTLRARVNLTPAIHNLLKIVVPVNERRRGLTATWLNRINPLGLAIWYMDDGSCRFTPDQRPRAHLATNGFTWKEAELLCETLGSRFNVACDVFDYKGPTIVLTTDGTEQFFDIIHPYVPSSMKYKLSKKYRLRSCVLEGAGELPRHMGIMPSEVISIEHENVAVYETPDCQYDLTVADNHNYFAGGILVHNSNVGIGKLDGQIIPMTRSGYRAETSPYEQHHVFAKWVMQRWGLFDELLCNGERIVGEWLYQAHGTRYDLPHDYFVPFDFFIKGNVRLPYDEFLDRISTTLPTPRLIHDGGAFSIEQAIEAIKVSGHGAIDPVEGAIWRVERKGKVDFLCKFVHHFKQDGLYLPEISGQPAVINRVLVSLGF